jgi:Co/Zn/Cd efflux system component
VDPASYAPKVRRAVRLVALLNLAYFGVEFAVAVTIGSVSLFADSIDFLEDACVNLLVLVALGRSLRWRVRTAMVLVALLLVPSVAALWTAWTKILEPVAPDPLRLTLAGAGAFAVNLTCALLLSRHRAHGGSLTTAVFLSARNDVLANVGIVAAGLVTAWLWRTAWPDVIVGVGIALLNARAAFEVYEAAREERREGQP